MGAPKALHQAKVYDRRMAGSPEVTAFILAGGKSTRMGTDKAFVEYDGRTLLARARWLKSLRFCGEHSIVIYLAFFLPMAATRTLLLK